MKTVFAKVKEYIPVPVMMIALLALVCGGFHLAFILSVPFSDAFNGSVSAAARAAAAFLSSWIPFSFAEMLLFIVPFAGIYVVVVFVKKSDQTWKNAIRVISCLLSVILVLYVLFVLMFAAGYRGSALADKMDLDVVKLSVGELTDTLSYVVSELNELADKIAYSYGGSSVMPYSFSDLNERLLDAYSSVSDEYGFIADFSSRIKPIILSPIMTYTHISGVYTYFTGESNVNTNYPDYVIAYTAAHELAHQRGIARENEANFVAYLVCTASDDDFIKYSGYLSMFEYLASALGKVSKDDYKTVYSHLSKYVRDDLVAYSRFFSRYRDSVASAVSGAVNNSYLKAQGTAGTASYGMVVDYAVAYHKAKGDVQ